MKKPDHHRLYRSLHTYLEQVDQEAKIARANAIDYADKHLYSQAEAETIRAAQHEANYHTLAFIIRDANYP